MIDTVKMARVLTEYSVRVRPGDYVLILGATPEALPLVEALYEAVLRRGGNPTIQLELPGLIEFFMREASDTQLDFMDPLRLTAFEKANVLINIRSPHNPREMSTVDPQRLQRSRNASRPIVETYFRRSDSGELRWVIAPWPTHAGAQQADMGLHAYTEFVTKACGLDQADPVAHWQAFQTHQLGLTEQLNGKRHVEIHGQDIELSFSILGRTWVSCHGDNNFPDGEIFTSPVEESVNGYVEFNLPTFYGGREVNGVRLVFKDGVVVEASAKKNESYLLSQLDADEGARRLGEFAIGTNYGIQQVTGSTLFDEKIGGTIHMALGEGFSESNGVNKSLVHWDMVHDMKQGGQIIVDDTLIYSNGQFI